MTFRKFIAVAVLLLVGLMTAGCAGMAISQGDDALKMKHYYDAASSYITALSFDPNNKDAKAKLANIAEPAYDEKLSVARSYEDNGNLELAYRHYRELSGLIDGLNKYVSVTFAMINARQKMMDIGNILSARYYTEADRAFYNEDYYRAVDGYKKVLSYTNPYRDSTEKLAESYYRMGKNYMYRGDYHQAAESFDKASQVIYAYRDSRQLAKKCRDLLNESEAKLHYNKAMELADHDRYKEAIEELKKSMTYVAHYRNSEELIERYTRMVNEKEAEEHYDNALELMAQNRYKEAKKEFEYVLFLMHEYKNARKFMKVCEEKLDNTSKDKDITDKKKDDTPVKTDKSKEHGDD